MPLATVHLIALNQSISLKDFLTHLKQSSIKPLVVSRVIRWIIRPSVIDVDPLLHPAKPWQLLLILPSDSPLPQTLTSLIQTSWTTIVGIPSRLTNDFISTNHSLLHPTPNSVPALTGSLSDPRMGSTSQTLELSPELDDWVKSFSQTHAGRNAVSMLNLLSFNPGKKSSYLKYGKAFAESIGSRRGGNAKLVGNIVHPATPTQSSTPTASGTGAIDFDATAGATPPKWDEFALAHYPSIVHFADMLASKDYQEVNLTYRVPSLRDTLILCTSEIEIEQILKDTGERAKL